MDPNPFVILGNETVIGQTYSAEHRMAIAIANGWVIMADIDGDGIPDMTFAEGVSFYRLKEGEAVRDGKVVTLS